MFKDFMIEYIEIGRMYKKGNLDENKGIPITVQIEPTIIYKANGVWIEYNPITSKGKRINVIED